MDILNLSKDRIGGVGGKSDVGKDYAPALAGLQAVPEHRQPFPVFCQKSDRYAVHGPRPFECVPLTNVMNRSTLRQVTLVP